MQRTCNEGAHLRSKEASPRVAFLLPFSLFRLISRGGAELATTARGDRFLFFFIAVLLRLLLMGLLVEYLERVCARSSMIRCRARRSRGRRPHWVSVFSEDLLSANFPRGPECGENHRGLFEHYRLASFRQPEHLISSIRSIRAPNSGHGGAAVSNKHFSEY